MAKTRNVAILIFPECEVLDFCGPFEVFSVTGKRDNLNPFNVYTVAEHERIYARGKLCITPHYQFDNCPTPDIVVIPGGGGQHADGTAFGSRREMRNKLLLTWIHSVYPQAEHILCVCTGALIFVQTGLAKNLNATTHHLAFKALHHADASLNIQTDKRIVDNGKVLFSGGISAGIDASFYLVSKLLGSDIARETAVYMEYDWWNTTGTKTKIRLKTE